MLALQFLQEGVNTDLSWLLYGLLTFFVIVIVVGTVAGLKEKESAPVPEHEAEAVEEKKPKKIVRASTKKKSK